MKKKIYTFFLTNCLTLAAILIAQAQDGSLDPTFGTGGKVTTAVGNEFSSGRSVAIQSDGKLVVAGTSNIHDRDYFSLARYNSDGTLDSSFDAKGIVISAIGNQSDEGVSIAIQSDDKIVVAGSSWNDAYLVDFALVRYNTDGTLDTTFSSDGKVTTDFGSDYDFGHSVAIQGDGKIVAAGYSFNGINRDFALVRYNTDGTLDTTFSSDGKVITDFGSDDDEGNSVSIQDDGKIVVAGYSYTFQSDFALARYNNDGTLDKSFDTDGKVTTGIGWYYSIAYSVAIQHDGKILAAGKCIGGKGDNDFALVRYKSDGTLDNTFDSDGIVTTGIGDYHDYGSSVAIQDDGNIVVAGHSISTTNNFYFAVVRYNRDGTLDNSFSGDGKITTDFGDSSDVAHSVAIQGDGKIVVAGNNRFMYAVARYNVGTVGIAENSADENTLILSPNPFNNEIFINGTKENDEILIFDEMGNEMIRENTFDTVTKINTEKLLPGFYFLHCTDGNKSSITKMVKF